MFLIYIYIYIYILIFTYTYTYVHIRVSNKWFFDRPAIVDAWGLGGPGRREIPSQKVGRKNPSVHKLDSLSWPQAAGKTLPKGGAPNSQGAQIICAFVATDQVLYVTQ